MTYPPISDGPAAASISSPSPPSPPMTEAQRLLAAAHGTPAEFARACYAAVPGFVSMSEAAAAVRKYNAEWDAAATAPPDTGDAVRVPSIDEEWLVAFVEGGRLYCLGWPLSSVPVSECVVIERATPEQRQRILRDMAASQCTARSNYARNRLAREGER